MKTAIINRLEELEQHIRQYDDQPLWIDGHNETVRVDIGGRRGRTVEFGSPYDARKWIEKTIDQHPAGGVISYSVDAIWTIYEDATGLRGAILATLPGAIIQPDLMAHVENGALVWAEKVGAINHPVTYNVDYLPASLALVRIIPGLKVDLALWLLSSLVDQYCDGVHFKRRWEDGNLSNDDNAMLEVFLRIYTWHKPGSPESLALSFGRFFQAVTKLA